MVRSKGMWVLLGIVLGAIGLAASAQEGDVQTESSVFAQPLLITSIGQSAGAAQARVVAIKAGIDVTYAQRATTEELAGYATLIVVLGASTKGLGAAGVNIDGEIAWATELLETARGLGIRVIAMHIEGSARRGPSSDVLIETFAPQADCLIVKGSSPDVEWTADESADGNSDGLFTTLAADHEIPITYVQATLDAVDVLIELFGIASAGD